MTPFCVVQDQEKKKVVISIRGSMSLKVYTYVAIRICMKILYTIYEIRDYNNMQSMYYTWSCVSSYRMPSLI